MKKILSVVCEHVREALLELRIIKREVFGKPSSLLADELHESECEDPYTTSILKQIK